MIPWYQYYYIALEILKGFLPDRCKSLSQGLLQGGDTEGFREGLGSRVRSPVKRVWGLGFGVLG